MQGTNIRNYFVKTNIEIKPSSIHRYEVFATKDIFSEGA